MALAVATLLVVEEETADVAKGVGSSLRGAPGGLVLAVGRRPLRDLQCGEQHVSGVGVEVAGVAPSGRQRPSGPR